jgi:hypothetical protein
LTKKVKAEQIFPLGPKAFALLAQSTELASGERARRSQTPTLAAWSDKIAPQAIAPCKIFTQYGKIYQANLILIVFSVNFF